MQRTNKCNFHDHKMGKKNKRWRKKSEPCQDFQSLWAWQISTLSIGVLGALHSSQVMLNIITTCQSSGGKNNSTSTALLVEGVHSLQSLIWELF